RVRYHTNTIRETRHHDAYTDHLLRTWQSDERTARQRLEPWLGRHRPAPATPAHSAVDLGALVLARYGTDRHGITAHDPRFRRLPARIVRSAISRTRRPRPGASGARTAESA